MPARPSRVSTTLAAPLATSVAPKTAMPTSAWRSAGASFTPSPVMPTTCPAACRLSTTRYLSSGNTSAKPSCACVSSAVRAEGPSPAARSSGARMTSPRPRSRAISRATGSASPVSIFTATPSERSSAMSWRESGRGGSDKSAIPTSVGRAPFALRATARTRSPPDAASVAFVSSAAIAWASSPHSSASVRIAPLYTCTRCPPISTSASVRRVSGENGWNEIVLAAFHERAAARGLEEGDIDRIAVGVVGSERGVADDLLVGETGFGQGANEREVVGGQRPRLVGAQDVQRRRVLGRAQARDEHALFCERDRSDRHRDREHHRQRHRHRAHEQDEGERQDLDEVDAPRDRQDQRSGDEHADDDEQPAHDARDHLLDVQLGMGGLDQLRGAAKERARARGDHERRSLATADDGSGVHELVTTLAELARLAGQRRLIDAQLAVEELHVRRDEVAAAHAHDVAGHQLARGDRLPALVAQHARRDLEPPAKRLHRFGRVLLLEKAQQRIDEQQRDRDPEVRHLVQQQRQDGDELEHPRRQPPELAGERQHRVRGLLRHLIGAGL